MKKNEKIKVYAFDDIEDELIGKVGTPRRDEYERQLKADIESYRASDRRKTALTPSLALV